MNEKMRNILFMLMGAILVSLITFFVTLFLVKIIWSWTIPDLFPGAVKQGLIAKEISWFTSFKIAILVLVFSLLPQLKNNK